MNNTAWLSIDNKEHADMDDTGDWSVDNPITQRAHRALPLPQDWPTQYTAPQGRVEQGWAIRTNSPEAIVDRLPEEYDEDYYAPTPLTTGELIVVWLIVGLSLWCAGMLVWFAAGLL